MRILVMHKSKFSGVRYNESIDHSQHEVVYFGERSYIEDIPKGLSFSKYTYDNMRSLDEELEECVKKHGPFDRVLARHEDYIYPAASLREKHSIEGMSESVAKNFRDKVLMKKAVEKAGLRVPRYLEANVLEQANWHGATVIKPKEGSASRGVMKFADLTSALEWVKECPEHEVLGLEAEEYIEGPIWHIDGYMFKGQPIVIQASKYHGNCLDFLDGQSFGSVQFPNEELECWAANCIRALGGKSLTFHLEAIESEDGPIFLECAARAGGGYIIDMFERKFGVHIPTLDIASDISGHFVDKFAVIKKSNWTYGDFLYPGHIYKGKPVKVVRGKELLESEDIIELNLNENKNLPSFATYRAQNLPLSGVIKGKTAQDVYDRITALFANICISSD